MSQVRYELRAPEAILSTHERLRRNGFPIVSVLSGRRISDSRVFFGAWSGARSLRCIVAPEVCPTSAWSAYLKRSNGDLRHPLLFVGDFARCMEAALEITSQNIFAHIAIATSTEHVLQALLDQSTAITIVNAALQGLVPIEPVEDRILSMVTDGRKLAPLLRSPYEGLVFYLLESRKQTRGRFLPNQRIAKPSSQGSYEVDLVAASERIVIEVDGLQHHAAGQALRDERKESDLKQLGYRVRRFSAAEVSANPVGVWTLILELLSNSHHHAGGIHGGIASQA